MNGVTDQGRVSIAAGDPSTMLGHDVRGAARAYAGGWGGSCRCTGSAPCEQHPEEVFVGELIQDRRPARWLIALAAGAAGVAVGLLLAVVLIPEQPDRILVPVPEPAPSMHVDPDDGVQA